MAKIKRTRNGRIIFTKEMKRDYTILVPDMLPIHFELMKHVFLNEGYKIELLRSAKPEIKQLGLKYVHNDTCYPALLVIGQFLDALESGKYDVDKTALLIMQTGGGCRASNYIHLLRKALEKANLGQVPVISFNLSGSEFNSGFVLTLPIIRRCVAGVIYGDLLMLLGNQTRAYELHKGDTDKLIEKWVLDIAGQFKHRTGFGLKDMTENFNRIIPSFAEVPVNRVPKVKVGVVGEIYVKYARFANNNLEEFLAGQDCEVMVPGLLGFLMFKIDARIQDVRLYGGSILKKKIAGLLLDYFKKVEKAFMDAVGRYPVFHMLSCYEDAKPLVDGLIGVGNRMGEGWFLPAEIIKLVNHGYSNIICTQPFGCLPTHICGKGMIHKIKEMYPQANIVPIDYDPGASRVNQENRIKLMLSVAREGMEG
ncbi:2-hydroxyacyl-CoA dehydratase [Lacrimispora sp. 210928-DFI.3.58]|uniref:2-hydroxyacyl-CoA dehydratase n=1 Tax=Lacrimispora sp. 210928-DFI.3.58 TaxID=2883214 RepID=UPI0015B730F0|nr:2-hydroxyacyl-CoA dehydratase [Lacrimispora sp. 210928-DFI.3.58]